ncbi:hypothetical protein D3C73_1345130 [compost metagenome]
MGDTTLQGDRFEFRAARRLATGTGVAALAVFDYFGCALEGTDLADTRNGLGTRAELDEKFEVLVGVEPL